MIHYFALSTDWLNEINIPSQHYPVPFFQISDISLFFFPCTSLIENMLCGIHPPWVTWYIIPDNVSFWRGRLEDMGECIQMFNFEAKSCFFFIKNYFTVIKLLLQKDNQIIFIADIKKPEEILPRPIFPFSKICHCNGSRVSAIILMDSFLVFEVTTGHMTRSCV